MRLKVEATRSTPAALAVARALGLSKADAAVLISRDRVLPAELPLAKAQALVAELLGFGCRSEPVEVPQSLARCGSHPPLTADAPCATCQTLVCPLCATEGGEPRCGVCAARERTRVRRKRARVAVLLVCLAAVGVWALRTVRGREARTSWDRTLTVDVVLVATEPVDPRVREAWRDGLSELERWFADEGARYHLGLAAPVRFTLSGTRRVAALPEPPDASESWLDAQRKSWALHQGLVALAEAGAARADVHVVVALASGGAGARLVEGIGEGGGSYGLVHGAAAETELGLELAALAHEVLHCLGAKDRYDEDGHAVDPGGLAEPEQVPRYPQRYAEVMCGEVPDGPRQGHVPTQLSEVRVGPLTARDVRWVTPP